MSTDIRGPAGILLVRAYAKIAGKNFEISITFFIFNPSHGANRSHMADNYYQLHQYVSNSTLSALQVAMGERPDIGGNKQAIYDFGNLVDALITEPALIDFDRRRVQVADGQWVQFDEATWTQAMEMRRAALEHPNMLLLVKNMIFQEVIIDGHFEIVTEEAHFHLPVRIKMDGRNKPLRTGMDLKTTIAASQKAFYDSLFFFEYDRQCAWYMDIAKLDRFWFAGVGKKKMKNGKHPVYFHAVERGDAFYQSGRAKYQRLAQLYHMLILGLNPALIIHNQHQVYENDFNATAGLETGQEMHTDRNLPGTHSSAYGGAPF